MGRTAWYGDFICGFNFRVYLALSQKRQADLWITSWIFTVSLLRYNSFIARDFYEREHFSIGWLSDSIAHFIGYLRFSIFFAIFFVRNNIDQAPKKYGKIDNKALDKLEKRPNFACLIRFFRFAIAFASRIWYTI